MKLTNFDNLQVEGIILKKSVVGAEVNNAGIATFTPEQVLSGLILRDPNGAGRADKLPTAADLFEAIGGDRVQADGVGVSFEFTIRNTANGDETITVTTNTGLTLSGTMTIAQNNSKRFLVEFTSKTAAKVYSLGTVVH